MKTRAKVVSMLVLMVFCFSAYEAYAFGGPGGRRSEAEAPQMATGQEPKCPWPMTKKPKSKP